MARWINGRLDEEEEARRAAEEAAKAAQANAAAEPPAPAKKDSLAAPAQPTQQKTEAPQKAKLPEAPKPTEQEHENNLHLQKVQKARAATKTEVEVYHPHNPDAGKTDNQIWEEEQAMREGVVPGILKGDTGYNDITVDFSSIKSDEQAMYFATTLRDDETKQRFLSDWAAYKGYDANSYIDAAEQKLGTKLFSSPVGDTAKRQQSWANFSSLPLYGLDGKEVNVNTASPATIIKAIRGIPDKSERAAAADAFIEQTKIKGSRLYGFTVDKSDLTTFLDTAALTESDYKNNSDFGGLFYGDGKHDEEDAQAYLEQLAEIEEDNADNPYALNAYKRALDKAYEGVTGKKGSDIQKPEPEAETEKEKGGILQNIKDGAQNFLNGMMGKPPAENAHDADDVQDVQNADQAQNQPEVVGQLASTAFPGTSAMKNGVPVGPNGEALSLSELEAMGFPEIQAQGQAESKTPETVYTDDPEKAMGLVMQGVSVEGPGMDAIRELYDDPLARSVFDSTRDQYEGAGVWGYLGDDPAWRELVQAGKEANGTAAANNGPQFTTVQNAIMRSDFPAELRPGSLMLLATVAHEASEREKNGTLATADKDGNPFPDGTPLVERLIQTDDEVHDLVYGVLNNRDEVNANKAQLREEQQKASEQTLADARIAYRNNEASEEQIQLVLANSDFGVLVESDPAYAQAVQAIDGFFYDPGDGTSGYATSGIHRANSASGVMDDSDYQNLLSGQMKQVVYNDDILAKEAGMSLEEYWGGEMTPAMLAERAATEIDKQGKEIAAYADTMDSEQPAQQHGDGVGIGYTAGATVGVTFETLYTEYTDSIYMGLSQEAVKRNRNTILQTYQKEYGLDGRAVYRGQLEEMLDGGYFPEEHADALRRAMAQCADIYDLAIDVNDMNNPLLQGAKTARENIENTKAYMAQNGTEGENFWFNTMSGVGVNLGHHAVNTAVTALGTAAGLGPAASVVGFATGYSLPGFQENVRAREAQGYSVNSAMTLGTVDTAVDFAANYGVANMFGKLGSEDVVKGGIIDMVNRHSPAAAKFLDGINRASKDTSKWWKYMGTNFTVGTLKGTAGELLHDEPIGIVGKKKDEYVLGDALRKLDAGETLEFTDYLNVAARLVDFGGYDIADSVKEWADGVGSNFLPTVIFSGVAAFGGAGMGYHQQKEFNQATEGMKAAHDIATGEKDATAENIVNTARTIISEMNDPKTAPLYNAAVAQTQLDSEVARQMAYGQDTNGNMAKAKEAKEQADTHSERANANKAAMDTAEAGMVDAQERVNNGDLSAAQEFTDNAIAYAKNKTGYDEHMTEAEQKLSEFEDFIGKRYQEAKQTAKERVAQRNAAASQTMAEALQSQAEHIAQKRAEFLEESDMLQAKFTEALERGADDAELAEIGKDIADVDMRLEAINRQQEALDQMNATAEKSRADQAKKDAKKKAEEKINRDIYREQRKMESAYEEIDRTNGVANRLKKTPLYVDAQQESEILAASGEESLAAVNRRFGTRFRDSRMNRNGKTASQLGDSSWTDFVNDSNGLLTQDTLHPETDLINLLARREQVQGDMQAASDRLDALNKRKREGVPEQQEINTDAAFEAMDGGSTDAEQNGPVVDAYIPVGDKPRTANNETPMGKQRKLTRNVEQATARTLTKLGVGSSLGAGNLAVAAGSPVDAAGVYVNEKRTVLTSSKYANDVDASTHEVGHAVQDFLGLSSTPEMIDAWKATAENADKYATSSQNHEAFAEFFRRFMVSDEAAAEFAGQEYVDMVKEGLRRAGKLDAVMEFREDCVAYREATALERAKSLMTEKGKNQYKGKSKGLVNKIENLVFNYLAAANDVVRIGRETSADGKLSVFSDPQKMGRMRDMSMNRASECIIGGGIYTLDGELKGESLVQRLDNAGGVDNFDDLAAYSMLKGAYERSVSHDYKVKVPKINELTGATEFVEETRQSQEYATLDMAPEEMLAAISELEQKNPNLPALHDALKGFHRDMMQTFFVDPGYMSQVDFDNLNSVFKDYSPAFRDKSYTVRRADGQNGGKRKFEIKHIKGSTETIINPLDSYVDMWNSMVMQEANNRVALAFHNVFEQANRASGDARDGIGMYMVKLAEPSGSNVLPVQLANGDKAFYRILDPELMNVVRGFNYNPEGVLRLVGNITRTMARLVTSFKPTFNLRNAEGDLQNTVNFGTHSATYLDGAARWLGQLKEVWDGESDEVKLYRGMGGGGTRLTTGTAKGRNDFRRAIDKTYDTDTVLGKAKYAGKKLFDTITMEKLSETIEQNSRFLEFSKGREDLTTAEGRVQAILDAQNVTTDFGKRGSSKIVRDLTTFIPFLNASLQGVYRTASEFKGENRADATRRFIKTVANTALTSALLNLMMKKFSDDDEKEEFYYMSDDLKAKNFFLPNFAPAVFGDAPLIRIKLEESPLVKMVNTAMTNAVWGKGDDNELAIEWTAAAAAILDGMNPFSSTIGDPLIATMTNKNWYGSRIVPTYLSNYETTAQYTQETPDAFIAISKIASKAHVNLSPMMWQYIAEQYTGVLGEMFIPAMSKDHNGKLGGLNAVIATARKQLTSDPLKSNNVVSRVYDNATLLTQIYTTGEAGREVSSLRSNLTERERKAAIRDARAMTHSGGIIYDSKKKISAIYTEIDEIEANDKLTQEEKNTRIRKKRQQAVDIALDANEEVAAYRQKYMDGQSWLPDFLAQVIKGE